MSQVNYKGLLQIHCQKSKAVLPHYSCTERMQGFSPVFSANVVVFGRNFTSGGEFSNKKQAEQNAAKIALCELGLLEPNLDTNEPKLQQSEIKQPLFVVDGAEVGQNKSCANINPLSTPAMDESLEDKQQTPSAEEDLRSPVAQSSATSVGKVSLSFKNIIQEKAQKMGLPLPQYETTVEGSGFVCTMTFNGQQFKSEGVSSNKKQAQQSAASVAIKLLNLEQGPEKKSLIQKTVALDSQSPVVSPEKFDAKLSYKNLFQENCQQRGNKPPIYETSWNGTGFISRVQFGDKTVSSKVPCSNKKQAQQLAAREALLAIGVSNPEDAFNNKESRKLKSKRTMPQMSGFKRTWVHSRGDRGQLNPWEEVDQSWNQAIMNKRQKLGTDEYPLNKGQFEGSTFALPLEHRQDLTVAEIWKEKKNIAVVGDTQSSFILYCTRVPGTCNIFNTRTMSLVLLEPGYRIVGLDACYTDHKGKVALKAERCADIIIPDSPDPVLTSCGVVLLYQDPESSLLQVLLKRYLSSQAFVNVAAALAQYFRRKVSGRPVSLDIPSLTEHICEWMLEEVQNIAGMHEEALHQLFSHMWKFNKRWCSVLSTPLPHDLESLKAKALDELAHRQASDVQYSEDYYHPWSLPKGNFKHRMLSTGLFLEPAVDCAVRELKEETGIKLDPDQVKNCPWIDLPHDDNLNPHKGDIVRYFLYVYHSDDNEELNLSQDMSAVNTSIEWEAKHSIDEEGFPSLEASNEQEAVENECSDLMSGMDLQRCQEEIQQDIHILTNGQMVPDMVEVAQDEAQSQKEDAQRRGIKRKRNEDDDVITEDCQLRGISSMPQDCNISLNSLPSPVPEVKQEVITAKSPHVQSSVHEECAWFSVEEARTKSPVFEQVYQREEFQQLLASILASEER
nr:uncharacterized protein LOC131769175 isoform X2 [Pocillopora verrucosa]